MNEMELLKIQEMLDLPTSFETKEKENTEKIVDLDKKIKFYTKWAWGFVIFGIVIAIIEIGWFPYNSKGYDLNLLGDLMSGTVGPIWALAGLFFIYVAFLGQKQQLLYQQIEIMNNRIELTYTRAELSGQKAEMKQQNDTLQQQKFENTFFQLLTLFNSIVNSMDLRSGSEIKYQGRDCFLLFYNNFKKDCTNFQVSGVANIHELNISKMVSIYSITYDTNKSDLSHYFRTLYHIVKLIDNSNILNKKQYTSIVRAQLSSYEQALLFYNCLHRNGIEKFKPLIEKYSLFKNLDESLILNQNHMTQYSSQAYGL